MSTTCLNERSNVMVMKKQKRREKSRDAARFRRHKESDTFEEICSTIPIPQEVVHHLDKSAIMRLLISYIKLRQSLNGMKKSSCIEGLKEEWNATISLRGEEYINALNAFLVVLSSDLDVLYASDNIKDYLGLSKFDLMGQSVLSYTHEGDHDELKACFDHEQEHKSFFLRLKSTLTVNGKSINLKSASYKVLRCTGVVCPVTDDSSCLVAFAEPIPHPSNIEHLLDCQTFVSQHSPDMRFIYCEDRLSELLGYQDSEIVDKSFFDFCHVADIKAIGEFFHKLYRLSQVETDQYRFLAKTGGYHWVVTQATVINNPKSHKPQCIVCVHYVISGLENGLSPLSSEQLQNKLAVPPTCPSVYEANLPLVDVLDAPASTDQLAVFTDTGEEQIDDDDCSVAPLIFTKLDQADSFFADELCYNAPSIGDPWPYSDDNAAENNLFPDVIIESDGVKEKAPDVVGCDVRETRSTEIEPNLKMSPRWQSPSCSPYRGNTMTPCGSRSPSDSAYGGSPTYDPYCNDDPCAGNYKPSECTNSEAAMSRMCQSVTIPRDEFHNHINNLKRGYVEEDPRLCSWNDEKKKETKRRCVAGSDFCQPRVASHKPDGLEEKAAGSKLERSVKRNPLFGSQLDDSFPLTGKLNPTFLLQPELDFQGKAGQRMIRNLSCGFLPELSLQDCEVNAPLMFGQDNLPLAVECVHLLDADN